MSFGELPSFGQFLSQQIRYQLQMMVALLMNEVIAGLEHGFLPTRNISLQGEPKVPNIKMLLISLFSFCALISSISKVILDLINTYT